MKHINSGAFDTFERIADLATRHVSWMHIDGAFGAMDAGGSEMQENCRAIERAASWAVDSHKWLQVPYDSGLAIVRDAEALMHCPKRITRSKLWQPALWPETDKVPTLAEATVKHGALDGSVSEIQAIIENDRRTRLY